MLRRSVIISSLFLLVACEAQTWKHFVIQQGEHYAKPLLVKPVDKVYEATYYFNETCKYDIGSDQTDWNKLGGISDIDPHNWSARLVWRYLNDSISIGYYIYDPSEPQVQKDELLKIPIDSEVYFKIIDADSAYYYQVNETYFKYYHGAKHEGIKITPSLYFGGNKKAPHNIEISVKHNWLFE